MRSGINRHPYAIATMQSLPRRGGDVRPDFDWDKPGALMRAIDRQKIKPAIRDGRKSGRNRTLQEPAGLVFFWGTNYLFHMPLMFEFCLPTAGNPVPASPDWLHEIKFDGYRLRVERDGDQVRLITRGIRLDEALPLDR